MKNAFLAVLKAAEMLLVVTKFDSREPNIM